MNDGELVRAMARLQRHSDEIKYILDEEIPNHPNGEALLADLQDNGLGYRLDCVSIVHPHLKRPQRWTNMGGWLEFR